ncbi:MAG TPA: protein kinase [Thermoanaerobaculia bacterium]|jgi:Tol biopolymer transport system component/tRNA A-37 threonylcarbamoyl transferase component Bud32
MTLAAGTKLGAYEVLVKIGAGGMGEVYRAKDLRLAREVAIKVLPEELFEGEERRQRFEREAKLLAALNHPGIAAIYSFEEIPGTPASASRHILVMELLEGETLRGALAAGKLPQRKALDYALQVAHGLAAAHEKGIVHRDLKPENLFVTKDGRIKILDFGLAKLNQPEDGHKATDLPTASAGTEPGVVMGTLGYMSPEQVKGKPADARSDIFSFGAILYETLSGKRAFHGDSAAETISSILREDPPELSATNQSIAPGLERIVRHCIEKNPEQRFHSAHDLAFDLEAVSGLSGASAASTGAAGSRLAPRIGRLPLAGLVVAALAAGLLGGRAIWNRAPAAPPVFKRLTYGRGPIESARFAPDGQMIVYAASWEGAPKPQLYSVRAESPESLRLALPTGRVDSISSKGEMLVLDLLKFSAGYARVGTLSQTPLSGSAPRELLEDVGDADWSADGGSFAVVRAPQWRYRLEFPPGKVLYETTGWISFPRISPKGDAVAFLDHPLFGDDRGSVAIVDRSGRKKTLATGWESMQGVSWSPSGEEIWFTAARAGNSRALYAVTPSGRLRPITATPSGMTLQGVSRDGRVLFIESNARLGFLGLLPGEAKERDLSGPEWSFSPILSADAKSVVFSEQGSAGGAGYSVYQRKADGSAPVRLGEGAPLAMSPDGKWVLTALVGSTPSQIVLLPTGAGEPRPFPKDQIEHATGFFGAFLPDGKRILFNGNEPARPPRVFVQDLAGGAAKPVTAEGIEGILVSRDGTTLVIRAPDGSYSMAGLEGGAARPIPGLRAGDVPLQLTADGRHLFLRDGSRAFPARVLRLDLATGRQETWKELTPGDPAGITLLQPAALSDDGKTILFIYSRVLSDLYLAEGLK